MPPVNKLEMEGKFCSASIAQSFRSVARLHDDIAMYKAFFTSSDHVYLRISLCG